MDSLLLRIVRRIINPPLTTPDASAGRAGSEAVLRWSRGGRVGSGKDGRPAAYPRRSYGSRSWERPGQKWQWDGGELRMKTIETFERDSLIVVVPPGASPSPATNRQVWNALAPMMGGHSRFKNLFQGNRA